MFELIPALKETIAKDGYVDVNAKKLTEEYAVSTVTVKNAVQTLLEDGFKLYYVRVGNTLRKVMTAGNVKYIDILKTLTS